MEDLLQGTSKEKAFGHLGMTKIPHDLFMLFCPSVKWAGIHIPEFLTTVTQMPPPGQN